MKKFVQYMMLSAIAASGLTMASCGDDNDGPTSGKVNSKTEAAIKATFPHERVAYITLYGSYYEDDWFYRTEMTYEDNLLTNYREVTPDGKIHDGCNEYLQYNGNTVIMTIGNRTYTAHIGDNGCVKELIMPGGKINKYEYDDDLHLIKYDVDISDTECVNYCVLTWEDDNMISYIYHQDNIDYNVEYTYSNTPNKAGLLPQQNSWIKSTGSYNMVNEALYYAGLLGKGTKNLIRTYRVDGRHSVTIDYGLNADGLATTYSTYGYINEAYGYSPII